MSAVTFCVNDFAGEQQSSWVKETKSFEPSTKGTDVEEESLKTWVHKQMHARHMLVCNWVSPGSVSTEPFPGVTYESTWNKQLKSSNRAGNGKTFAVSLSFEIVLGPFIF